MCNGKENPFNLHHTLNPFSFQYLEKSGVNNLQREHFSFSTKIFIGEFLKPTGMMSENGEEKYVTLNENEMIADVDKIRKENGWKPRVRVPQQPTTQAASNSGASLATQQV